MVRQKRSLKRDRAESAIQRFDIAPSEETLPWSAALAALAPHLRKEIWKGARPEVILSDHFVHYAVIPWYEGMHNLQEREAFLRHHFQLAYGEASKSWNLRMSDGGLNKASIASGVEQGLIYGLQDIFMQSGFSLNRIYPNFMLAVNEARLQAREGSFWLVQIESGRLTTALVSGGLWILVKSIAIQPDPSRHSDLQQLLAALIERESVVCGIDTAHWPILAYCSEHFMQSGSFGTTKGRSDMTDDMQLAGNWFGGRAFIPLISSAAPNSNPASNLFGAIS